MSEDIKEFISNIKQNKMKAAKDSLSEILERKVNERIELNKKITEK